MATKPTTLARWATQGGIAVPSEGKKDAGWVAAERPPAEWLNWMAENYHQWQLYLNDFESDPRTWSGAHDFNASVSLPDDTLITHGFREISIAPVVTWSSATNAHLAVSGWLEISSNGGVYIPIQGLPVGSIPTTVYFQTEGDGAVDLTAEVYRVSNSGGATLIGAGTYNNVSASALQRQVDATTVAITRGQSVFMHLGVAGIVGTLKVGNITLRFNRT